MPTLQAVASFPDELNRALGPEGETEYRQLLRVVRAARGSFFLFPVESDFSPVLRDGLLARLRSDLAAEGSCLRVAKVNSQQWDVFALPDLEMPVMETDVVILIGLEKTPDIVPEIGAESIRPPALALLNQQREALHQRVPAPFIVWCPPYVYTALMEQAPDFFDHYAGLFHFYNAAPENPSVGSASWRFNFYHPAQPVSLSPASARSAATFYEEQITQRSQPTPERARALLGLAEALVELRGSDYAQHVRRALHVIEDALALLSQERDAYQWARGQIIKGSAYLVLSTGDLTWNLQQAITCYEAALEVFTESVFPYEWAKTQNGLGNVYGTLLTGDRTWNLKQAITYYEAALRVRTEFDFPQEWATTQSNLGNVYGMLLTGNQTQNLLHAIKYCEAALRVRTETNYPYEWAATQNNLGNAYSELASGDRTQNLQQAIVCYRAALRVHTNADFPYEWARIQYNLGVAYRNMPTGDRAYNLLYVVECYNAALEVYTEADFPKEWADTQFNLAIVHGELGNRIAARLALHRATAAYLHAGLEAEVERSEDLLRQISPNCREDQEIISRRQ